MKQTILALSLLAAAGAANASLSFNTLADATRTEAFNLDNVAVTNALGGAAAVGVGSMLDLGYLSTNQAGTVSYSYLGQESAFNDKFYALSTNATPDLVESDPFYTTVSVATGAGKLDFKFEGDHGIFAKNNVSSTSDWGPGTSIGLLGTNLDIGGHFYQYVIGYNDSAGAHKMGDWDDQVIGVNLSPVPEPETWAMLLGGLGLLGFVARSKKI